MTWAGLHRFDESFRQPCFGCMRFLVNRSAAIAGAHGLVDLGVHSIPNGVLLILAKQIALGRELQQRRGCLGVEFARVANLLRDYGYRFGGT